MKLTMENAHLFLEELELENQAPSLPYNPLLCIDCNSEMKQDTYFYYCPSCQTIDFDKPIKVDFGRECYWMKSSLYKRKLYCVDKLNMITCHKHSRSPKYSVIVEDLRYERFDNIKELKRLMKKKGYHRFYKFMYCIWYDIKKTKLISLTYEEIDKIATQFVQIEQKFKFKQTDQVKRKNMMSYYSIIYLIMKKNNITGFEHIILPKNHIVNVKFLRGLI